MSKVYKTFFPIMFLTFAGLTEGFLLGRYYYPSIPEVASCEIPPPLDDCNLHLLRCDADYTAYKSEANFWLKRAGSCHSLLEEVWKQLPIYQKGQLLYQQGD